MTFAWLAYVCAVIALILSHAILSARAIRPRLISVLGRPVFLTAHSVISVVALAALIWTYGAIDAGPLLWTPPSFARITAVTLMPIVCFLLIGRLTSRAGEPERPLPPTGIYRITRAPGSLAVLLWAALHLLNTGDARRVVLFAAMAFIGGLAMAKNERILRRSGSDESALWLRSTSLLPLAALLAGRQSWSLAEIGLGRLALALALYVTLLFGHVHLFGVDPRLGLL